MTRLVVFRGDARDSKSLDQLPVRIGRGPQNDIVLEDPAKSVSRVHAEIRLEGGRIMLVDLKSDNGIWVAGSRVSRVELKPDVVASIGPFRLQLETDEAARYRQRLRDEGQPSSGCAVSATHPTHAPKQEAGYLDDPVQMGGWYRHGTRERGNHCRRYFPSAVVRPRNPPRN